MVSISVSFVLLLVDDLDGEPVADNSQCFLVDGRPAQPLYKTGGYRVFTAPNTPCSVSVISARYCPALVRVDPGKLDPADPVVALRLPRRGDLDFPGCERLEGEAPPGSLVFALAEEAVPLTLREERDGVLTLGGYTPARLCRLRFAVGSGKKRQLFVPAALLEDGSYRLERPLGRPHKEGEPILRAYAARSGSDGRFAVQMERGAAARVKELVLYDEEVGQWACLSVPAPR